MSEFMEDYPADVPELQEARFYDPRRGDAPLRLERVEWPESTIELPRSNCFRIVHVRNGTGSFWADAACHRFASDSLIFLVPYQRSRFQAESLTQADLLQFHANFLCVETFHAEVGCSGVLFKDPYGIPVVTMTEESQGEISRLLDTIHGELNHQRLAFQEVALACLKVLLVLATRLKTGASPTAMTVRPEALRNPLLQELSQLIEARYCEWHAPADYAQALHVTVKSLGRLVRQHLGQTLSELIQARILIHAKWELLHTLRPVKEIAREVGYRDELYFSRLFKKATGCSPRYFREFETEIRGGSNLSMFSSSAPILKSGSHDDNSLNGN